MENLKQLRMSRGLSQQALAEKFNLTQQSIYKYENGLAEPDIETLKNFSIFFGTSIDYLVGKANLSAIEDMFITLSPTMEEIKLLQDFRGLPSEVQASLSLLINKLAH